jgi:hypothetical protein
VQTNKKKDKTHKRREGREKENTQRRRGRTTS